MRRLEVANPCGEDWGAMRGDARTRHCDVCARPVHDLSARTEREAEAILLLFGHRGLCVRFEEDARGRPRFAPAPRAATRPALAATAAIGLAAAGCGAAPVCDHVNVAAAPPRADPVVLVAPAPPPVAAAPSVEPAPAPPPADVDTDRDGVVDREDACPTVPGHADPEASQNGCPRRVRIVKMGDVAIVPKVQFAFASASVPAASRDLLDAVAAILRDHPEIKQVAVEGHASADEPKSLALSHDRAKRVVDQLIARGVDPARLVPKGLGAALPLADGATRAGREQNRRIEFRVLDSGGWPKSSGTSPSI